MPPLGERDDVQARRHQLPRPDLANLRRSRFDARGTRRQRCLPQPAVLGSPRILARFRSGGPPEVRDQLNRILQGWSTYFDYGSRKTAYRAIDNYVYQGMEWLGESPSVQAS
jgi:Group II intron, maturase-specific domain